MITEHQQRLGRFHVSLDIVKNIDFDQLAQIFRDMVIVRAEVLFHLNGIEYIAVSPRFRIVEQGAQLPTYQVKATIDQGKLINYDIVEIKPGEPDTGAEIEVVH